MEPKGSKTEPLNSDPFEDTVHLENGLIPPPPPSESAYSSLPPGWEAVVSPKDGRMYYWEKTSGKTSWTHPNALPKHQPYLAMAPAPDQSRASLTNQQSANVTSTVSMDSGASGIIASRTMKSTKSFSSQRPITHQCYAIVATLLFFPLGLFALIYSFKVESAWSASRTEDSFRYARRALLFSRIATVVGAMFWIWFIFFRGPGGVIFDFRPLFEW